MRAASRGKVSTGNRRSFPAAWREAKRPTLRRPGWAPCSSRRRSARPLLPAASPAATSPAATPQSEHTTTLVLHILRPFCSTLGHSCPTNAPRISICSALCSFAQYLKDHSCACICCMHVTHGDQIAWVHCQPCSRVPNQPAVLLQAGARAAGGLRTARRHHRRCFWKHPECGQICGLHERAATFRQKLPGCSPRTKCIQGPAVRQSRSQVHRGLGFR